MRPLVALVVIAALNATACGLLSSDPPISQIPPDGVSGFGDSSPIELCLGTARVVPASDTLTSAGLCVPNGFDTNKSPVACDSDAACSGIERCICGRCIVEACQGVASCGGGLVCRGKRCTTACGADAECAPGERCISGGCARACTGNSSCYFGERCDPLDGVCASKLCGDVIACGAGDTCELEKTAGDIREPAIVTVGGERMAFVEIRTTPENGAVYRARIDTPERWTADPPEPVLTAEAFGSGEIRAGAPSVLAQIEDGSLEIFVAVGDNARIARASSSDRGLHFDPDPSFSFEPTEPWEAGRVGSPSAVVFQGATYLFYEAGARAGVGLARIEGASIERLGLVLTPSSIEDPFFWRGITEVGAPHALGVDGLVRLYFTARGAEGGDAMVGGSIAPADRNDSIGLATTLDMNAFELFPAGPVLARVTNLLTYLGEREPTVEILPEGVALTFLATDATGASTSGLARSLAR
jgi:hypothetical protein